VQHVEAALKVMKANQSRVEELLDTWSNTGLFARYQRPASLSDFGQLQRGLRAQRLLYARKATPRFCTSFFCLS
jgi:hypothetical protein